MSPSSSLDSGASLPRPEGGFAHEWPWEEALGVNVHIDAVQGIAWVRISECRQNEQERLRQWLDERMMARPLIDRLEPQDAVYVWDYATFVSERDDSID